MKVFLLLVLPLLAWAGLPQAPLQPELPGVEVKLVETKSLSRVGGPVKTEFLPAAARFLEKTGEEEDMDDVFVDEHNEERTIWGLGSVTWSEAVATEAAAYAATCTWGHSSSSSRTHDGVYWGENLAASAGSSRTDAQEAEHATYGWNDERYYWNCGNVGSGDCKSGEQCGHLTQVIWHSTTEIGCAVQHCSTGSPWGSSYGGNWVYSVCQYKTGGNYNGQHPLGSSSTTGCAHCSNGVKDYDETDVDCGGSCVGFLQSTGGGKCAETKACDTNADCQSGKVCTDDVCSAPSSTCATSGSCVCNNAAGTSTKYVKVKCASGTAAGYTIGNTISAGGSKQIKTSSGLICNDCTLCDENFSDFNSLAACS